MFPTIPVFTSRWTVSSGEIVATSLKGKSNTKFFEVIKETEKDKCVMEAIKWLKQK